MGKQKPEAPDFRRLFGQNLVELRGRVGLSQQGTADRAGLHRTEVALIEAGKRLPRLDTIFKLGGAVEVEPCALLRGLAWELLLRVKEEMDEIHQDARSRRRGGRGHDGVRGVYGVGDCPMEILCESGSCQFLTGLTGFFSLVIPGGINAVVGKIGGPPR